MTQQKEISKNDVNHINNNKKTKQVIKKYMAQFLL